jgi:predicted site-specific integrase-resolvase
MTEAEVLALPAAVDLATAGRALGIGRTKAFELAREGRFPVKVLQVGKKFRVPRTALLKALNIDPAAVVSGDPQPAA